MRKIGWQHVVSALISLILSMTVVEHSLSVLRSYNYVTYVIMHFIVFIFEVFIISLIIEKLVISPIEEELPEEEVYPPPAKFTETMIRSKYNFLAVSSKKISLWASIGFQFYAVLNSIKMMKEMMLGLLKERKSVELKKFW